MSSSGTSRDISGKSTLRTGTNESSKKRKRRLLISPKSAKRYGLQEKLRNCILESNPDQMRHQLRDAQDTNLELEQELDRKNKQIENLKKEQLKKRKEWQESLTESKMKERLLLDENKHLKDDKKRIISQKLQKIHELTKIKLSLEEKDIQIEHLDTRLKESTKLLGSNLEAIKCQIQSNSMSPDVSKPSTSYQTRNSITLPNNDNMFDDIIRNLQELLESQLQCSICNEVYITPVVVKCGHTFCEECISTWTKTQKNCPECRMQVTGLIPCKAIDSYISSFVESFVPKDYQNARKVLIDSRSKKKRQTDQEGGQRGDESQSDTIDLLYNSIPSIDRISLVSDIPVITPELSDQSANSFYGFGQFSMDSIDFGAGEEPNFSSDDTISGAGYSSRLSDHGDSMELALRDDGPAHDSESEESQLSSSPALAHMRTGRSTSTPSHSPARRVFGSHTESRISRVLESSSSEDSLDWQF